VRAYSMDLRQRVLADCDGGMGTKEAAQKYSVSTAWVRRLKQRRRQTGSAAPRPASPGRPCKLAPHEQALRDLVRADPDATLAELRQRLGVPVSTGALSTFLRKIGLSFKKKSCGRPSRSGPTWRRSARTGPSGCRAWTRSGWCSSTRRGPAPT